jgi:hypothetical protein
MQETLIDRYALQIFGVVGKLEHNTIVNNGKGIKH